MENVAEKNFCFTNTNTTECWVG